METIKSKIKTEERKLMKFLKRCGVGKRGELNDGGWELMPENASLCDNKELVKRLVDKCGLSPEFIE